MSSRTNRKLYLLAWRNRDGDHGTVLFGRPLRTEEQRDYLQSVYGDCVPGEPVESWIHWSFEPTDIIEWPNKLGSNE